MKRFVMLLLFVVVLLVTSRASAAEPPKAKAEPAPHRCTCGCETTGQCKYPNCSVGCGFLPQTAKTKAPAADPSASCGKVSVPEGRSIAHGSGTVVACEGGLSLVLTNRHVCPQLGGGKSFECGGKRYPAWCCCVDNRADLALLIVDAELPACTLAAAVPDTGTPTVQFGHPYAGPQRPKRGVIRGFVGWLRDGLPILHSGINTEQGDSGSGVFANGQLVGVTWGEGGSCVHLADVYQLLDTFCVNSKSFPAIGKATHGVKIAAPAVPQQMQPAPCPGGTYPGGNGCPNGQCPMPARGIIRRS